MNNWNNGKCRHGYTVEFRPYPRGGDGWVQEFAAECPKCSPLEGKQVPCSLPYKPGPKREAKPDGADD